MLLNWSSPDGLEAKKQIFHCFYIVGRVNFFPKLLLINDECG